MTPIAGFIIAVIAGWIVPGAFRAAATVVVPWLAVLAAQTWLIAAGHAVSPPGTVSQLPQAIGYWAIQAVFLALALGIAGQLSALRAGRAPSRRTASPAGRRAVVASAMLSAAAAAFGAAWLLDSPAVRHHAVEGSPPVQGVIGMVLCVVTFAALGVLTIRRRRARARAGTTGKPASAPAAGARS